MIEDQLKNIQNKLLAVSRKLMALQKENDFLNKHNIELKQKEIEKKELIEKMTQKINILQSASGSMAPEEKTNFEKTISGFIKQIDKFIGMLSK